MITLPELAAKRLGSFLHVHLTRRFGSADCDFADLISVIARLSLECIGNSDALYHDVEHTMLVSLVGFDILEGRSLFTSTSASDYAHLLVACLFHDIGYVRGILKGDSGEESVIDGNGGKAKLPRGASDAALTPYHVDRSKLFAMDRVLTMGRLDPNRIANAIEFTRFPSEAESDAENIEEGLLLRAADLIGQLGDPHYLRKANALYHEFEEVGMNRQLGYASPADLTDKYPQFYWNTVSPHIQTAIRYLNMTASGQQWVASLYSNVFRAEQSPSFYGPRAAG
jgi:hypothetical protein